MLNRSRPFQLLATLAAAAAIGAFFAGSLRATPAPRPAPPACVIAVIDLEAAIAGLKEGQTLRSNLETEKSKLESKINEIVEKGKNEETKLEAMPKGTPEYAAQAAAVRELVLRARFEKDYSQAVLNELETKMLKTMYEKIEAAAESLAKTNGYHMVMTSDASLRLPEKIGGDDLRRFISLKRMMYIDPQIEITQEVIAKMNNEFASGASGKSGGSAVVPTNR